MATDQRLRQLDHFVKLARAGRLGGSSDGEKCARQLAIAMIQYAASLDGQALEGAIDFLRGAAGSPASAQELIGYR